MERLEIFAIADQRNFQVVTEDFQVASGLTALYKNVPCQLYIHFFNDDETPFAEQFFSLKGWSMVLADDFSNSTAVQLRADKVEAVGGNTLKAVFSNVNTIELAEVLGDSSAVKLGAEIIGSADGVDVVVWQFNMQIRNRREDNTEPTAVQGNYYTKAEVQGLVANRVEKVQGMGLSSNDFTDEYKEKLDATVTAYDDTEIRADIAELETAVGGKVEKVQGKGLSSEDFTTAEKQKLNGLQNYDDTALKADIAELTQNKLDKSAYTPYDDTEIKADIAELDRKKLDKADYVPYDDSTIKESISNLDSKKLDKSAYTPYDDTAIKADIQEMQGGITSLANTVKGKADVSALAEKADKSELFSKEYAELKNTPDLTVYATKEQVGNIKAETDLSNYVGDVSIKTATQDVITVDGSKIKIGDDTDLNIPTNATEIIYVKGKKIDISGTETSVGGYGYIDFDTSGNINLNTYGYMIDRLRLNGNCPNTPNGIVVANNYGLISSWMLNQHIEKQTVYDSYIYMDFYKSVHYVAVESSELQILFEDHYEIETLSTIEIWVKPQMGDIDTLSFSTNIQLVGDIPTNLQYGVGDTVYVFVARHYYNSDKHANIVLLNYAYSFNENQYYRDQQ